MMHTGTAVTVAGSQLVQLCVTGRRVQISSSDGEIWSGRARTLALISIDNGVVQLEFAGREWTIQLDDPDRFTWQFIPSLRRALDKW